MADRDSRAGTSYFNASVLEYIERVHAPRDEVLQRAFDGPVKLGLPPIQIGASEGKLVTLLLKMVGAKRVVELGSLAGYSGIQIARALPPGGHLWTLELSPKLAAMTRENVEAAGLSDKVTVLQGPALESLPKLEASGPFDAVFVDADKGSYDHYGAWAARHIRRGGLLLGDNAFYFGRLTDDEKSATPLALDSYRIGREQIILEAAAMRRFHEQAREHFDTVCIPAPDGLLLGVKK